MADQTFPVGRRGFVMMVVGQSLDRNTHSDPIIS